METLAVVAYRQPVLRAEIEAIRGVQSGEVLRQLIERDLVRIVGSIRRTWPAVPLRNHQAIPASFRTAAPGRTSRADVLRTASHRYMPEMSRSVPMRYTEPSHQSQVAEEEDQREDPHHHEPRQTPLPRTHFATATRTLPRRPARHQASSTSKTKTKMTKTRTTMTTTTISTTRKTSTTTTSTRKKTRKRKKTTKTSKTNLGKKSKTTTKTSKTRTKTKTGTRTKTGRTKTRTGMTTTKTTIGRDEEEEEEEKE